MSENERVEIRAGNIVFVAENDEIDRILHQNAWCCPRCQSTVVAGDWPWCNGKREDHRNPHYGWHFAKSS